MFKNFTSGVESIFDGFVSIFESLFTKPSFAPTKDDWESFYDDLDKVIEDYKVVRDLYKYPICADPNCPSSNFNKRRIKPKKKIKKRKFL